MKYVSYVEYSKSELFLLNSVIIWIHCNLRTCSRSFIPFCPKHKMIHSCDCAKTTDRNSSKSTTKTYHFSSSKALKIKHNDEYRLSYSQEHAVCDWIFGLPCTIPEQKLSGTSYGLHANIYPNCFQVGLRIVQGLGKLKSYQSKLLTYWK